MEEAYGTQIYNNWHYVRHISLHCMKHHATIIGLSSAIFARNGYKKDAGNVCHSHLTYAIDRNNLTPEVETFIQHLISKKCFRTC